MSASTPPNARPLRLSRDQLHKAVTNAILQAQAQPKLGRGPIITGLIATVHDGQLTFHELSSGKQIEGLLSSAAEQPGGDD